MEARSAILAVALLAICLTGYALLTSLLTAEDSPLGHDNPSGRVGPDVYDALHDVAFFTVFGNLETRPHSETAYVVEGMSRLATALELLGRRDGVETTEFEAPARLRRAVVELRDPGSPEHAAIVQDALISAASATVELQRRHYPQLARAADGFTTVASRLRADRMLSDQHAAIEEYFDAANDVLAPMILLRR